MSLFPHSYIHVYAYKCIKKCTRFTFNVNENWDEKEAKNEEEEKCLKNIIVYKKLVEYR